MNTIKRLKLQHLREKIVQDLDVRDVLTYLISKKAINEDDKERILLEPSRKDQARHLLDLLPKNGSDAFDTFVESLQPDYFWLYNEMKTDNDEIDSIEEQCFYDAFLMGGVPPSPPYYVERVKKMSEVRSNLRELERGSYVVLHGMTGSGKSCLAAAAIYDKSLLKHSFKGCVYWLSVGDSSDDDLLLHMTQLLQNLKIDYNFQRTNLSVPDSFDYNVSSVKQILKNYFLQKEVREGLLILDDVMSVKQIEAFDIGCKIMVTTKDLEVIKNVRGRHKVVKVDKGFSQEESLMLLAKSIDEPVEKLPPQAKEIHNLSQGFPMIIALIGGQLEDNKQDVRKSHGRWNYYKHMLNVREFSRFKRHTFSEQNGLFETIEASVNNLPQEMKEYYMDFVIFLEDVNIKPEVLQTIWSLQTKYEVEDIMSYFTKKSLAVTKWNEQFCSSVYGIHDLLLCYLKKHMETDEKIARHRKLLRRYLEDNGNNYALLPNDNYIYSFIGYHLYEAQEWTLFSKLYFDLEFIGSKLKVTGPADVLNDYKKYRQQIIGHNEEELTSKLNDFIEFVQRYGLDLCKYSDLDIVQCGLQYTSNSHVHKLASEIAKLKSKKLYIEFILLQNLVSQPLTLPLREEIFAACFIGDKNDILVADGTGTIQFWELDYVRILHIFGGHMDKVVHLELHPQQKEFLSCSEDGTVKLWNLEDSKRNKQETIRYGRSVASPRCLQRNWDSMFLNDINKDGSLKTLTGHNEPVDIARYSNTGKKIVSGSKNYFIVWDSESGAIQFTVEKIWESSFPSRYMFSNDDSFLFATGRDFVINIYNSSTSDSIASFCYQHSIIEILRIPSNNNKIIVITRKEFQIWQWDEPEFSKPVKNLDLIKRYSMGKINQRIITHNNNADYVCAAASSDGTFVTIASTNHVIHLWDVEKESLIIERQYYKGIIRKMDMYLEDRCPLLLYTSDDRTVSFWRLEEISSEYSIKLLPKFHAIWFSSESDPWIPMIVAPDTKSRLQIIQGCSLTEKSFEDSTITLCALSLSGGLVFYACADGKVKIYDTETKISEIIIQFDHEVTYLQLIETEDIKLLAAGDNTTLKIWKADSGIISFSLVTPVVQSFFFPNIQQLLLCNQDASVKLLDLKTEKLSHIIAGHDEKFITSADMTNNRDTLVLGDKNCFHMALLNHVADNPYVTISTLKTHTIDTQTAVTCCRISPDDQVLALGLQSGAILVWDLKKHRLLQILELHRTAVCDICYSPLKSISSNSPLLLVSVAEQIGWWNLSSLLKKNESSIEETKYTESLSMWSFKEGSVKKPLLLGCVLLCGSNALKISSSPDFTSFVTIDMHGIMYLMKVFQ